MAVDAGPGGRANNQGMADRALSLLVALGVGLLLGVERERRQRRPADRGSAGVRTFALVGLLGGLGYRVGGVAVTAVALGVVGVVALAGYVRTSDADPGMTTEVALLADFLLGVLAQRDIELAGALAVAIALLLAERDRLHKLIRDTLSEQELHDGLLFATCALIILPLVPEQAIGPNHAFNPSTVWRLVAIVMAMQGAGYIALRAIGPRYGLLVVGLLGGFVSSTATIALMGTRAADDPRLRKGATAAGVASSVATIVLLAVVIGAVSGRVLGAMALPLILAGVAAIVYAGAFASRAVREPAPESIDRGRAFDLRLALILAGTVSAVLLIAGALNAAAGRTGLMFGTALAGFADSQSAAISAATLAANERVSTTTAALAILAALTTNTVSKAAFARMTGKRPYALDIWPGLGLILLGAWGGLAVSRAVGA